MEGKTMTIRVLGEPERIGEEAYGEFSMIIKKIEHKPNHFGMIAGQGEDLCPKLQNQPYADFEELLLNSIK